MGQKVRPTGFRIGIVEDWRSRWYASKKEFGRLLIEDYKIREFVKTKYLYAGIPKIEIERTRDQVVVHLHTARPGIIIGRKGQEVDHASGFLKTPLAKGGDHLLCGHLEPLAGFALDPLDDLFLSKFDVNGCWMHDWPRAGVVSKNTR